MSLDQGIQAVFASSDEGFIVPGAAGRDGVLPASPMVLNFGVCGDEPPLRIGLDPLQMFDMPPMSFGAGRASVAVWARARLPGPGCA